MAGYNTLTYAELGYVNTGDFSAFNSSASEGSLLAGRNEQPAIPALFFDQGGRAAGKAVCVRAWGTLGTTGTPTLTFQGRLSSTVGSATLTGTSVGVSSAITCGNGVSNKYWALELNLICNTPGQGTGNTTLNCFGQVLSPTGFASPFIFPLEPTAPDTATWTQTIDNTLTLFFNLSVTWSASSASNTITCKGLQMFGWN